MHDVARRRHKWQTPWGGEGENGGRLPFDRGECMAEMFGCEISNEEGVKREREKGVRLDKGRCLLGRERVGDTSGGKGSFVRDSMAT